MTLRNKTALVTGSTSGIGLGVANALAAEGANIMLNGFGDAEAIDQLVVDLAARHGVEVDYDGADLLRADGPGELVESTRARFGTLDVLVNNAGIQHVAPVESFPTERWDAIIALNLSAVFLSMRAAIPIMRAQGWGRIINVASAHGLVASANKVAYVAAKHGVVGATKVAALELANDAITVNAICPGWVLTPLVERQLEERAAAAGTELAAESDAMLAEKQPMRQFTSPEAIGALAVYLCSDAARTVTGTPISIDGGWVAQ